MFAGQFHQTMSNKTLAILKSMSVLYVEDDRETREELAIMLETWVGNLAVAGDGEAGLAAFGQHRPDIVVTDIQMPGLNGLAMCEEIRRRVPARCAHEMKATALFCRMLAPLLLFWSGQAGAEQPEPLRMGFYLPAIRDANLADVKVSLGVWVEEIGKPYSVKITASTYDDMQSMRQALDTSELNFISAPGMELVEILKPDEVRQGYARRHEGTEEGLALIVAAASNIRKFSDLRGKRVARLDKDHLYEYFLEVQCLKAAGQDCRDYLSIKEQRRDIQAVHDVFFGRVDAALVSIATMRTAVELNPQVGDRIRVILDWKVKGLIFGMMTRHTKDHYRTLIVESVQEAMKTPRARQVLELFKTDYIEPISVDALDPFRALLKEYQDLRRRRFGGKK